MTQNSSTSARTRAQRCKVLEFLAESGNVSYSCKRAGISRETYYEWRRKSNTFSDNADAAIEHGKSFVNDLAHTQLILNIQKGDMQAVRFQLSCCHPDYQPRRPRPPETEPPVAPVERIEVTIAKPHDQFAQPSDQQNTDNQKVPPESPQA